MRKVAAECLAIAMVIGLATLVLTGQAPSTIQPGITPSIGAVTRFANGSSAVPSVSFAGNALDGFFWNSTGHTVYTANGNALVDFGTGVTGGSGTTLGFTSSTNPAGGSPDTSWTRAAAGVFGGQAVRLSAAAITVGSGTGITVDDAGQLRQQVYRVTVGTTALVCNATTCDVTVATLPAKTFVVHAMVDQTVAFTCSAVCTTSTLSATLGKTAGGTEYLVSWDADAAVARFGTTAAQLGASLTGATVPTELGDLASWTATTAVVMRFTSGTGNIGNGAVTNLGAGSLTFYLTTVVMP